jgi:anaerobic magnesium-protoporphyrin IX monomethyl ester cyclase
MKITLVNPSAHIAYKNIRRSEKRQPSLGVAYLAGQLRLQGHAVNIIDADAMDFMGKAAAEQILKDDPALVGISITTPLFSEAQSIVKYLRESGWEGHVCIGGPHASAMPEETLEQIKGVDSVIIGEGERSIAELADTLDSGKDITQVAGIVFKARSGEMIHAPSREYIACIDDIPLPGLDLLPMEKYTSPMWSGQRPDQRMGVLITSRGCIGKCKFCGSNYLWGRHVRYHSVERVVSEITRLVDVYHVDYLVFNDDTFTINKKRCIEICDAMASKGVDIPFMVTSRVDTVDHDFLARLKQAGCFLITYGIESGSEKVLRDIGKNINIRQIRDAVRISKQLGIKVVGNYMLGHFADTEETCNQTIQLARELQCDISQISICIPYPGSDLFQQAIAEDRMESTRYFDDFGYYGNMPWKHPRLPARSLVELQEKAYALLRQN